MTRTEAERMVADAIILERAIRVIERREPTAMAVDRKLHYTVTWLDYYARMLRTEAERGVEITDLEEAYHGGTPEG